MRGVGRQAGQALGDCREVELFTADERQQGAQSGVGIPGFRAAGLRRGRGCGGDLGHRGTV